MTVLIIRLVQMDLKILIAMAGISVLTAHAYLADVKMMSIHIHVIVLRDIRDLTVTEKLITARLIHA